MRLTAKEMSERNNRWALDYQNGMTLQEIGDRYAVTRERVRQVIRKIGVTKKEGGHAVGGGLIAAKSRAAMCREDVRKTHLTRKRQKRLDRTGCTTGVAIHRPSGLYRAQAFSLWLPGYHKTPEAAAQARADALAGGRP